MFVLELLNLEYFEPFRKAVPLKYLVIAHKTISAYILTTQVFSPSKRL